MPIEPDPLNTNETGEVQLPPELTLIENRLRDLHQANPPMLDRDDLMFQSGYAAALAAMNSGQLDKSKGASWGWPALSGAFATIAAVLAVALWLSPMTMQPSQQVSQPEVSVSPAVVVANQSDIASPLDAEESSVSQHPIEQLITPYLKKMLGPSSASLASSTPTPSSFGVRSHVLLGDDLDLMLAPRHISPASGRQKEPLKANSYRNEDLWEQL